MRKPSIFIVCEETAIADSIQTILSNKYGEQFEFAHLTNGKETLSKAKALVKSNNELCLIVSMLKLSDMSGADLLSKINDTFPESFKIVLYNEPDFDALAQAVNNVRVYKVAALPWEQKDMGLTIQRAISRYQHNQEMQEYSKIFRSLHHSMQEIYAEDSPDRIMGKFMQSVIDTTHPESIYLIFTDQNKLAVRAVASSDKKKTKEMKQRLEQDTEKMNKEVMEKVNDTINSSASQDFKAVIPITLKGKVSGYLYVENPESQDIFLPNQKEALNILALQALIAMNMTRANAKTTKKAAAEPETEKTAANEEVSSITPENVEYVRGIQHALMPEPDDLKLLFPESFVYHRPTEDITSDMFWFAEKYYKQMVAVFDFNNTGLGSAFLSVVIANILDQVTSEHTLIDPQTIVKHLNNKLNELFKGRAYWQEMQKNISMALIMCDPSSASLMFVGINRNLLTNHRKKLIEHECGDFQFGSKDTTGKSILQHTIKIYHDDTAYLYTNGVTSNFGEGMDSESLHNRFKDLVIEMQAEDMTDQLSVMDRVIQNWKGEQKQQEDMLTIGLKFGGLGAEEDE